MIGVDDPTTYGNRLITLYNLKSHNIANSLPNDFFAMLEFLKKDLTREEIKKELEYIRNTSEKQMYINDLNALRKELEKDFK